MLREHCQDYIDCVNVLVQGLRRDYSPKGSAPRITAPCPVAVKDQVIRDAQSVIAARSRLVVSLSQKALRLSGITRRELEMSETRFQKEATGRACH